MQGGLLLALLTTFSLGCFCRLIVVRCRQKKITIVKCALLIAVAKGSIGTHVWLTRLHIMDGV